MIHDAWQHLKQLTAARIALGRAGGSLPTQELLDFQLAHARARDAVHLEFETQNLQDGIQALGCKAVEVSSAAGDRQTYLQRPDLGRRLDEASRQRLKELATPNAPPDLVILVSNGLSALAAHRQAVPLLQILVPLLRDDGWKLAPIVVVRNGRVAIQDEVGLLLAAPLALILLGERPGLGSPDSLGAYLVFHPRPGLNDAARNCVSNIRPEGLTHAAAARLLHYLLTESRARKLSGVPLKDDMPRLGEL